MDAEAQTLLHSKAYAVVVQAGESAVLGEHCQIEEWKAKLFLCPPDVVIECPGWEAASSKVAAVLELPRPEFQ